MKWFYINNNQQAGPVSDSQLDDLVRSGTLTPNTLVWREGMAEWQPISSARSGNATPPSGSSSATTATVCAECGRTFAPDDVIRLNNQWICSGCKPTVLQRLKEGAMPTSVVMWRHGKQLVTQPGAIFPDRCVKCNAPANGFKLKRTLYWNPTLYYLLLIINLLIGALVILLVRKKAIYEIGLCEDHRAKRKQTLLIGWLGTIGGMLLAIFGGIAAHSGWPILIGVLVSLTALIYGGVKAPQISAAKINKENVWIRGVGQEFMANLPEWMGPK